MLTLVDEFTRECLALVGISMTGERFRQILARICMERGEPEQIWSDKGSEFISQAAGSILKEKELNQSLLTPESSG